MYSPNLGSENPPHEPSVPPYPQETKSSNSSIVIVIKELQRNTQRNANFIELDGSKFKCRVKVDAYEVIIYNTGVSYFL